jgi:ATP-dependent 26S proteasome regulatory subunit
MFQDDLTDYILSGHALLSVITHEKDRAIELIRAAAHSMKPRRKVFTWSIVTGWQALGAPAANQEPADPDAQGVDGEENTALQDTNKPDLAIQSIAKIEDENAIFLLKDFGFYLRQETYPESDVVIGWLDELRPVLSHEAKTIVFVGPDLPIPNSLRHNITEMELALPDAEEIERHVRFACEGLETADGQKVEVDEAHVPEIVRACRGMTESQTIDRVALALRKHKDLNGPACRTILHEKAGVIRSSGILTYSEPPVGGLALVGGYQALKDHVLLDKPCFSKEAQEFGLEPPKGLLLVGIPGCGKTLLSQAIASEFGFPLIAMDVANVMSKYVGDSEGNMREAIRILERVAPCVLQLDEIEKGFGGVGDLDGGASRRVFGQFIKWLNDRISPVYVVATANEVQSLPPEFSRKGRFDEIFGLDLPQEAERRTIFAIHLKKRGQPIGESDLETLAQVTEGYTGADIEQSVKLGMKMAFSQGARLGIEHLVEAVKAIVPLSKTEPQRIAAIHEWCKARAKAANPEPNPPSRMGMTGAKKQRKVTV